MRVIEDTTIGDNVSIFFNAELRGDIQAIKIARRTNLQEHPLVQTNRGISPALVGEDGTFAHRAMIHGGSIGYGCVTGMGATVLDNAEIEAERITGAHMLGPKGMTIPQETRTC